MAIGNKKVIVRMSDNGILAGYASSAGIVNPVTSTIDLLDTSGRIQALALGSIRYMAYVRDFNLSDRLDPERLTRKTFLARPRSEGLWLRVTFLSGEVLEGLAALDVNVLDDAIADQGVFLVPPDVRSNTQRLFVPRVALASLQIVGVVTTPSKLPAAKPGRADAPPALPFPEPGA